MISLKEVSGLFAFILVGNAFEESKKILYETFALGKKEKEKWEFEISLRKKNRLKSFKVKRKKKWSFKPKVRI